MIVNPVHEHPCLARTGAPVCTRRTPSTRSEATRNGDPESARSASFVRNVSDPDLRKKKKCVSCVKANLKPPGPTWNICYSCSHLSLFPPLLFWGTAFYQQLKYVSLAPKWAFKTNKTNKTCVSSKEAFEPRQERKHTNTHTHKKK